MQIKLPVKYGFGLLGLCVACIAAAIVFDCGDNEDQNASSTGDWSKSRPLSEMPALAYVPQNAVRVKLLSQQEDDDCWTWQLMYGISESWPCKRFLDDSSKHLLKNGWRSLDYDLRMPESPMGHKRGWTAVDDDPSAEAIWFGWWVDKDGNAAILALTGGGPSNTFSYSTLVTLEYWPAKTMATLTSAYYDKRGSPFAASKR